MAMNLLKQFKEEDAAQKELVNDVDSVRDDVQVNASGAGLATNDLGHSMPRDPRKCQGIDTFDNDLDDHMNIEDDSLVYDENASYSSNEVL
ncbi:hypothetical protein AHAS_Ahas20G0238200 [Arachis hypogaea]